MVAEISWQICTRQHVNNASPPVWLVHSIRHTCIINLGDYICEVLSNISDLYTAIITIQYYRPLNIMYKLWGRQQMCVLIESCADECLIKTLNKLSMTLILYYKLFEPAHEILALFRLCVKSLF